MCMSPTGSRIPPGSWRETERTKEELATVPEDPTLIQDGQEQQGLYDIELCRAGNLHEATETVGTWKSVQSHVHPTTVTSRWG